MSHEVSCTGYTTSSPPSEDNGTDSISNKKLRKGKGTFATSKCLIGFEFDGVKKTIWLEDKKRASLLPPANPTPMDPLSGKMR